MALGTLSGDLSALTHFGEAVGRLGGSSAMTALSRELGDESLKLIAEGFAKERDPYGLPWARKYPDGRKVLDGSTHRLARSFAIKSSGPWGVIVGSNLSRSRFPQSGTGLFGPRKQRIRSRTGGMLRFTSPGGATLFRASVKGQQQRRMVPIKGLPAPVWNRAIKKRAINFYNRLLARTMRQARITRVAA